MRLISGETIWTKINEIPKKYTYLSDDLECDVAIIGAGITGAICAYHLTKAGIDTIIVDKNIIGYESTSASTSILQYEIDYNLVGLKGIIGEENAVKSFKLTADAVYEIQNIIKDLDDDCGFNLRDCFYYTNNESDISLLRKEYDLRKNNGFDVEFIDKSKAEERFSFPVKAGIYTNGNGGEIDPYRFAHALISKAEKNGLKVFENTEIVKINPSMNGVQLTTKNGFNISCKKALIAAGFESKNYIQQKTAILSRSFTIATKPIKNFAGWYKRCIIRDTNSPYTYLRTTSDDRILIGGEDLDVGGINSKVSNLSHENPISLDKYNVLQKKLGEMFPNIRDIGVEYSFSGIFGETRDGLPFIGEHEKYPNCYFCLGYGSNGILYATLEGKLLTDLYQGKIREELDLFKFHR
ncbi:NAD(P)/FAD-dependent oxidoreductase [Clostridiisalibacter paucivorans]|uniref:NAD(P)/FAD-dependent oxidoreductase n=1 Tax=Clostridiisalibacter paucivorans TaxID=408753 RepID=UPI00047A17A0|nr:FAD-dependent oxidoreductase [Clostridiisalibacter paucivorans]